VGDGGALRRHLRTRGFQRGTLRVQVGARDQLLFGKLAAAFVELLGVAQLRLCLVDVGRLLSCTRVTSGWPFFTFWPLSNSTLAMVWLTLAVIVTDSRALAVPSALSSSLQRTGCTCAVVTVAGGWPPLSPSAPPFLPQATTRLTRPSTTRARYGREDRKAGMETGEANGGADSTGRTRAHVWPNGCPPMRQNRRIQQAPAGHGDR